MQLNFQMALEIHFAEITLYMAYFYQIRKNYYNFLIVEIDLKSPIAIRFEN